MRYDDAHGSPHQGEDKMTDKCMVNHEMEQGLVLSALDRVAFLRERMEAAVRQIVAGKANEARWTLDAALEATDVGAMKEWQAGEEPL
jgi:hypothetical protein